MTLERYPTISVKGI